MAPQIARAEGIGELTPRHWQVIRFMRPNTRPRAPAPGSASWARPPASPVKELYQLFPKGPAKLAAKIAGIPKPRGCI